MSAEDSLNDYNFDKRLSRNNFVEVYKVTSKNLGKSYVLKQHDLTDMTNEQKWDAHNEANIM